MKRVSKWYQLIFLVLFLSAAKSRMFHRYLRRSYFHNLPQYGRQQQPADLATLQSGSTSLDLSQVTDILKKVKDFDKLNCIPRIMCQYMSSQSLEDIFKNVFKRTTTTSQRRTPVMSRTFQDLTQIVRFLDLLNLDSLSFYPYVKGALLGFTVRREDQCLEEFPTCPKSENDVLHYLNNHQGGFFKIFNP